MRIKISALATIGSQLTFNNVVTAREYPGLLEFGEDHSDLTISGSVSRTETGFYVTGNVAMSLNLSCSRCLSGFTYNLKTNFSDQFVPENDDLVDPDDLQFVDENPTYKGDSLNLNELITESIVLAIPMKVVCRDDCQGICSECGQVLNEKTCQCNRVKPDPRLAVLADLLKSE